MAAFYLYTFNLIPHSHSPSASSNPDSLSNLNSISAKIDKRRSSCRTSGFTVLSTHSNPRILKSNRRSRYGQVLSPYDTDDNAGDEDGDWFFDDEDSETEEFDADRKKFNSQKGNDTRQGMSFRAFQKVSGGNMANDNFVHEGSRRQLEEDQSIRSLKSEGSFNISKGELDVKNGKNTIGSSYHTFNKSEDYDSSEMHGIGKLKPRKSTENKYCRLSEEIDLDEKWFPLLDYLSTFGLKESHFIQMYERHMPSLQINACSAQERLEYLSSVGVKHRDIKRIILRQPQILEYTVENNLKSHVAFLVGLGIPDSRIGHVIAAAPSLFSYSVENSLKPTVRYLIEEVGIKKNDLGKVVQLSPQILVQRIDNSWNTRYSFLSRELGAPRDSIVKMVTKHPQLLHYSIEDGFLPRINFLRSIGMRNSDILKVLTNLTQVLSLSLEDNLKPKYMYLVNELRNEVHSLTKYPMYLSLSLDQRIRPRHRDYYSKILQRSMRSEDNRSISTLS
uniref:Transcription termination factor MTERF9, chloroplastic n=1 Tax=Vitis vinifera TaxID=29760 RepID=F6HER7_VITVI